MPACHPPPRLWLMTDERQGDELFAALHALPRGAGVIFRHYRLAPPARRALFERVRRIARKRRLVLLLAGTPRQALAWRADGVHGRSPLRSPHPMMRTVPVHRAFELQSRAVRNADLVLLSPVFATRSHPGARVLGRLRFGLIARRARRPVVALGGMTLRRARAMRAMRLYGWAAIDGLAKGTRRSSG